MSNRLRKLWDKNPKAAAKECSINFLLLAIFVLIALSNGFSHVPNFWHIFLVIFVAGFLIGLCFYYAKIHQKEIDEEKDEVADKEMK